MAYLERKTASDRVRDIDMRGHGLGVPRGDPPDHALAIEGPKRTTAARPKFLATLE